MSRASAILVVLLVAGLAAILFWPQRHSGGDAPFAAVGVTVRTYTGSGDPSWEVRAREGIVIGGTGTLSGVEIVFLSDDEITMTATADRLTQAERTSTLAGGVTVERSDGLRLETDELVLREDAETLDADAIALSVRDLRVEGGGFAYDLGSERATLSRNVVATLDRDSPVTVRGERAEESDDVLAVEGDVRVETFGGEYRCHRIEATEEAVRLLGDVSGTFAEGDLRADSVQIDEDGRLIAAGQVLLRLDLGREEASDGA